MSEEDVPSVSQNYAHSVPSMTPLQSQIPVTEFVSALAPEEEEEAEDELGWLRRLPWWHRPRPLWLFPVVFLFAVAAGIMLAARIELLLSLTCDMQHIDDPPSIPPQPLSLNTSSIHARSVHIPSAHCRQSVEAQSLLSIVQLQLLMIVGMCSMLTTGFWSQLSDRTGRKPILFAALGGGLINDAVALTVSSVPMSRIPTGWWILVWGSVIEGVLGSTGLVTAMAQSYMTDVTASGTRSHEFALLTGTLFLGVAFGPMIGGLITKYTESLSTTILVAVAVRLFIFVITPGLPDSLRPDVRVRAVADHRTRLHETYEHQSKTMRAWVTVKHVLMTPFHNLAFLLPQGRSDHYERLSGDERGDFQVHSRHEPRNTSLLFLSAAYAVEVTCMAVVPIKIQYVQLVFGWSSSAVGLFVSFSAMSRMLTLTVLLPLIVRYLHHMPKSIVLPQDNPLVPDDAGIHALDENGRSKRHSPTIPHQWSTTEHELEREWQTRSKKLKMIHDSHMDKYIAVVSSLTTVAASVIMARAKTPAWFLIGTFAVSLGAGVGSALSSLGMAVISRPNSAGRLFGAWAVLSTLSGTIVGPMLFSLVFSHSAAYAPSLSFYLVAFLQISSVFLLCFVRLGSTDTLEGLPPRPFPPRRST